MSDAQQQTFDFIAAYIEAHGQPPTHREVAVGLGLTTGQAAGRITALQRNHYIRREHFGCPRAIVIERYPGEAVRRG